MFESAIPLQEHMRRGAASSITIRSQMNLLGQVIGTPVACCLLLNSHPPSLSSKKVEMPHLERTVTRTNSRAKTPPRTLPPPRGLVKIRVFKTLFKSARAFASLTTSTSTGDATSHTTTRTSPSSTSPIPSGYNSDD